MPFAGGSGNGSAAGGGVPACNADAAGFVAVQLDFLNVVFKNPFDQRVSGFRMAPAVAGMGTDKTMGFSGAAEHLVMVHMT